MRARVRNEGVKQSSRVREILQERVVVVLAQVHIPAKELGAGEAAERVNDERRAAALALHGLSGIAIDERRQGVALPGQAVEVAIDQRQGVGQVALDQ